MSANQQSYTVAHILINAHILVEDSKKHSSNGGPTITFGNALYQVIYEEDPVLANNIAEMHSELFSRTEFADNDPVYNRCINILSLVFNEWMPHFPGVNEYSPFFNMVCIDGPADGEVIAIDKSATDGQLPAAHYFQTPIYADVAEPYGDTDLIPLDTIQTLSHRYRYLTERGLAGFYLWDGPSGIEH